MAQHEPRILGLWATLSFLIGVGKIAVFFGMGMWAASFYIPKDFISTDAVESLNVETSNLTNGYLADKDIDTANIGLIAAIVASERLERIRWATRDRILDKAAYLFWIGTIAWGLFHVICGNPNLFDSG